MAAGSPLTASQAWVTAARLRSSGAPGPPILVGTQPGSRALDSVPGQRRATAKARHDIEELAVGVRLGAVPAPAGPLQVVEVGLATSVHARTEVDQPAGCQDQRRQQVRGEHVDSEDVTEAVDGLDAARFAVADADVVDNGVIAAEGIGLLRHLAHPGNALHIASHDVFGTRQRPTGAFPALLVAGVQGDGVAVVDEQPGRPSSRAHRSNR